MSDKVKVMVVDDSALMRNLITRIINADPEMEVVAKAMNGAFALSKIEQTPPDVIVLDLEMPEMNGIQFLKERRSRGIGIPVVILSSLAQRGAKITMEALSLGAVDFIPKPSGSISEDIETIATQITELVRGFGKQYRDSHVATTTTPGPATVERPFSQRPEQPTASANRPPASPGTPDEHSGSGGPRSASVAARTEAVGLSGRLTTAGVTGVPGTPSAASAARTPTTVPAVTTTGSVSTPGTASAVGSRSVAGRRGGFEIVAIGISTGGPNALRNVFARFPATLTTPMLVVQHMPPGFTEEFARSLDRICALEVKEAADGDIVKPGRILIAPGDHHIVVERRPLATIVRVTTDPPMNGHRPSAGVLFRSVAAAYGNKALGVIMTGMGKDGSEEIGEILLAGGVTLGQDEPSSVVYGMPKVAFEKGCVVEQVALDLMADRIHYYLTAD